MMRLYDADDDNVKPGNLVRDIDDLLLRGIEAQHQQSLNLIVICQACCQDYKVVDYDNVILVSLNNDWIDLVKIMRRNCGLS